MGEGGLPLSGEQLGRQFNAFRLARPPRGPSPTDCPWAIFSRTPNQKDTPCTKSATPRMPWKFQTWDVRTESLWAINTDAERIPANLLEIGPLPFHGTLHRERPYLPPGRTGARCGSSEGLPLALHSELSPSPEPPSAHCTAEEPVWAKQGPLSVD